MVASVYTPMSLVMYKGPCQYVCWYVWDAKIVHVEMNHMYYWYNAHLPVDPPRPHPAYPLLPHLERRLVHSLLLADQLDQSRLQPTGFVSAIA